MEDHHLAYIAVALVAIIAAGGAVMILGEGTSGAATFNPACYDQCRSHFCPDDGSSSRTQTAICNHNCLDSCIAK